MRKILIVLMLASSMLAFAQDKPTPQKEPTVAELKLQIAQKDVENAQIKLQMIQAQAQLAYQNAQAELAKAQQAVIAATPKREAKK